MKKACKYLFLFVVGGILYYCIEIVWRGYSHWTMMIIGGICFVLCGITNEPIPWETPLWKQMVLCSGIITGLEFVAGMILNVWLGLGIWDYSSVPFNLYGQICLPYAVLWMFLSVPAIILDDWLRYLFFRESRPHYTWR